MATKTMKKTNVTEEETKVEVTDTKKVFNPNDGIACRSVTHGKLFVDGVKTGMKYTFFDYDDDADIEYRDLVALVRSRDKAVYNPRFIIIDEDFIAEYPALKKFYNEHFSNKNIKEILNLPEHQMKEEIAKLPKGAFDSLKTIAANQVVSGEIDSVRKIKALDEAFNTDFSLLNELLKD